MAWALVMPPLARLHPVMLSRSDTTGTICR
jgi:hypothetical protein